MGKNNVTFRMRIASFLLSLLMILGLSPASHSEDLSGAITVWWWGEEQTPGLQEWMANTVQAFEEAYPTIDVDAVYQNTDAIIPGLGGRNAVAKRPRHYILLVDRGSASGHLETTRVPMPRWTCAKAAISLRRKPSTTVSFMRNGCPCGTAAWHPSMT